MHRCGPYFGFTQPLLSRRISRLRSQFNCLADTVVDVRLIFVFNELFRRGICSLRTFCGNRHIPTPGLENVNGPVCLTHRPDKPSPNNYTKIEFVIETHKSLGTRVSMIASVEHATVLAPNKLTPQCTFTHYVILPCKFRLVFPRFPARIRRRTFNNREITSLNHPKSHTVCSASHVRY